MGVDCQVQLPQNVRLRDVADVIGALLGCPVEKRMFESGSDGGWATHTVGVTTKPSCVDTCAEIEVKGATVGRCPERSFLYHFEYSPSGHRGLLFRSYSVNIALAKGLVDFFGGTVDYSDCDDIDVDYEVPAKSDEENHACDNGEWYAQQERKLAVQPLTKDQVKDCIQYAAYKE